MYIGFGYIMSNYITNLNFIYLRLNIHFHILQIIYRQSKYSGRLVSEFREYLEEIIHGY